ncbi:MAG: apolipoprotein N-acyltransferase [Longimicrobiales bacterium]
MRRPESHVGTFLSVVSGVLVGATFSPFGGPVLPFLGFAPAAMALRRSEGPGSGMWPGFVVGFVAHGIGLYWMVPALAWRTWLAVPTYLLVLAVIGMVTGAAFEGARRLHAQHRWPLAWAMGVCWVGFEWLAPRVPGLPYAWLNVGGSLAWYSALGGTAALFGAGVLALWVVVVGGTIGTAVEGHLEGGWARRCVVGLVLCLPVGFGWWEGRLPVVPSERVVIAVQPGSGVGLSSEADRFSGWSEEVRALADGAKAELVVFPERFIVAPPEPQGAALSFGREVGIPVLFGAPDVRGNGRDSTWFNAAFLATPDASAPQIAHKNRLVPGLEAGGSTLNGWLPGAGRGYQAGSEASPLRLESGSIGVLICYDSAFPGVARSLTLQGADLLVIVSNDDWLDPAGPPRTTWAYWQHETQARLRAIENRLPVVQVAATGQTFSLTPRGSPVGAAALPEPFQRSVVALPIAGRGRPAPFTNTGDVLGVLGFLVLILALLPRQRTGSLTSKRAVTS